MGNDCIDLVVKVVSESDFIKDDFKVYKSDTGFIIHLPLPRDMSLNIYGECIRDDEGEKLYLVGEGYGILSVFENILKDKDKVADFYRKLLGTGSISILHTVVSDSGMLLFTPSEHILIPIGPVQAKEYDREYYMNKLQAFVYGFLMLAAWFEMNYLAAVKNEDLIPFSAVIEMKIPDTPDGSSMPDLSPLFR